MLLSGAAIIVEAFEMCIDSSSLSFVLVVFVFVLGAFRNDDLSFPFVFSSFRKALLEDANKAMVELARDYTRQQAIIEKYRTEDNSLISTSQLTQSQPTNQQQQLAQAQAQGLQQQAQPILQQPQSSPPRHQMQQVGTSMWQVRRRF